MEGFRMLWIGVGVFFVCLHMMSSFNTCLCQAPCLPSVSPLWPHCCSAAHVQLVVSPAQPLGRKDKALSYVFTSWLRFLLLPNELGTGKKDSPEVFLQLPAGRGSAKLEHPRSLLQSPGGVTGRDREQEGLEHEHISPGASAERGSLQPIPFQPPTRALVSAISCKTNQLAPAEVWKVHRGINRPYHQSSLVKIQPTKFS